MKPSHLHFSGIFMVAGGILLQIAGAASVIPGPVGLYSGIAAELLGLIFHGANTPNATTPPPAK